MRVASGSLGRPHRQLLLLLLLPSLSACQYLFGDFSEEQVIEIDPSQFGGRDGTGGEQGTPGTCVERAVSCEGPLLLACSDGFWAVRDECDSAELCDDSGAGSCLVCVENEFECLGDQNSRRCEGGEWVDQPPCEDGLRCDQEIEQCAACRVGDGVCTPDGEVLCMCREDQTGWEARNCPLGCTNEGFNDHCVDDISATGAPADACSGI